MSELGWELARIGLAYAALFAGTIGICWWGLRRIGPEDEIPELKKKR